MRRGKHDIVGHWQPHKDCREIGYSVESDVPSKSGGGRIDGPNGQNIEHF
jgi:hypothetical protein